MSSRESRLLQTAGLRPRICHECLRGIAIRSECCDAAAFNDSNKPLTYREWSNLFFFSPNWRVRPYNESVRVREGYAAYLASQREPS